MENSRRKSENNGENSMKESTKIWLKAALIRAIKTIAQTAVATIGTSVAVISSVDWLTVGSTSLLSGLLSILTSVKGLPEVAETEDK